MPAFAGQLVDIAGRRLTTAEFDLAGALQEVLRSVGLAIDDAGGSVTFAGADPIVKSPRARGG
ncbi:hypothetical protein [Novosphingobium endophyticum]|uniref:hypothetical protein n=1 Tax=Novosphingobium endophyticum TaxID=1955250 RepID=UPI00166D0E2F|nr:hypothetical protein [Novosphingobium endophyticum]